MPFRTIARITAFRPGTVAASGEHAHAHGLARYRPPADSTVRPVLRRGTAPLCAVLLALACRRLPRRRRRRPPTAPAGVLTVYLSLPGRGLSADEAAAVEAGRRLAFQRAHGNARPAHGAPGAPRLDQSGGRALGSGPGAGERRARHRRPERRRLHRRARARRVGHLGAGDQRRRPPPGVPVRLAHEPHPQRRRARGPRRPGALLPDRKTHLPAPHAERPARGGAAHGPPRRARGQARGARGR